MPKSSSPKKQSKEKSPKKNSKDKSPKKGSDKSSKKDKSPKKEELSEEEKHNAPITHVIFDLDGVLLDSIKCFELFLNTLNSLYEKYIPVSVAHKIKDKNIENVAKIILKEVNLPMTTAEFLNYYNEGIPGLFQFTNLYPGVSHLVEYFRKHNMPVAVVTDSTEDIYNHKVMRHKIIMNKFSHAVCYGSDPEKNKGKPAPYIYEIAASRFKEKIPDGPYNILVFEDTSDGVDAALAAGMKVVWIPDSRIDASLHDFNRDLMVIRSLDQFQPELFRLPCFSDLYSI